MQQRRVPRAGCGRRGRLGLYLALCCAGLASCQPQGGKGDPFDDDELGSLPVDDPGSGGGPPPPPFNAGEVRINEVMVSNRDTLADEAGAYPPWVELYNSGDAPADLSGISLSDDAASPEKWVLPAGPASVVPAHGYLVVFCDGSPPGTPGLHASFTLKPGALELVLNKGSEFFFADGSALDHDQSVGRAPDGDDRISLLESPTPGAPNSRAAVAGGPARGDVNRDGILDISDAAGLLGYLFLGDSVTGCRPMLDANGDGALDISDPLTILGYLFMGEPPLPELTAEDLAKCGVNRPPLVPASPVYHTYPGYPAEFRIGATDPEGDQLLFQALDLPAGASLEEETGLLRWTPDQGQLGPFYLTFSATDEAVPPNKVGGRVVFQVHPLDGCTRPVCDPATGCEPDLAPLEESCCGPRPPQVPEPDVGCPEAAVLYVGRNPPGSATIGRLENCDLLRLVPLGQGGYRTTLHLEALCLVPTGVQFHVRLESADGVLMEESASTDFTTRADGFVQRLGLNFIVEVPSPEGKPALLTVTAADTQGLRVERGVRVTLTTGAVPPLP